MEEKIATSYKPVSSIKSKTKTKKSKLKSSEIKQLWKSFDETIKNPLKQENIECVYDHEDDEKNDICKKCNSTLVYTEDSLLVCTNDQCGIVESDILDQSAEWRFYGNDDSSNSDPARCGMPNNPLLQESSYGSKVLKSGVKMSYKMRKVCLYAEWYSMSPKEKSLYQEFLRITSMAQIAGIPKIIIDDAIYYHKMVSEYHKTFRGTKRDSIIAASIYISCRINNNPRTAKEIAQIFALNDTNATKGCSNAQNIINELEKNKEFDDKTIMCRPMPYSFIERFCSKLNMNNELTQLCVFIAIQIHTKDLMQKNTPISIAAGLIYFVSQMCHLNISKSSIKQVAEISEVTIHKCYRDLLEIKHLLVPDIVLQKYNAAAASK